jgi:hypothetical protein
MFPPFSGLSSVLLVFLRYFAQNCDVTKNQRSAHPDVSVQTHCEVLCWLLLALDGVEARASELRHVVRKSDAGR